MALSDIVTSPRSSLNWQLKRVQQGKEILHCQRKRKGFRRKTLIFPLSKHHTLLTRQVTEYTQERRNVSESRPYSDYGPERIYPALSRRHERSCHVSMLLFGRHEIWWDVAASSIPMHTELFMLINVHLYMLMCLDVSKDAWSSKWIDLEVYSTPLFSILTAISGPWVQPVKRMCEAENSTRGQALSLNVTLKLHPTALTIKSLFWRASGNHRGKLQPQRSANGPLSH